MDFIQATDVRLPVTFSNTPEPVIPDTGSVTFSVFDVLGNSLVVDEPVATDATTFRTVLTIPAIHNTIPASARFTRRFVQVQFTRVGAHHQVNLNYRVIPRLAHTVRPEEVRGFIGVNPYELEDADIDLTSAYFQIEELLTPTVLETALTSGTMAEMRANELIRMKAAMSIIPSLKHRVAQQEKNGVKSFTRPTIKSFDDIMAAAKQRYDEALGELIGIDSSSQPTLIVVTQDSDPVTGGS